MVWVWIDILWCEREGNVRDQKTISTAVQAHVTGLFWNLSGYPIAVSLTKLEVDKVITVRVYQAETKNRVRAKVNANFTQNLALIDGNRLEIRHISDFSGVLLEPSRSVSV